MKKSACIFSFLFVINSIVYAQSINEFYVSAGYGFPYIVRSALNLFDGANTYSSSVAGPLYGKFEYRVSDVVGLGVDVAYASAKASYHTSDTNDISILYNTSVTYSTYSILGRINFHFGNSNNFDPYAGIGLGFRNGIYKYNSDDPNFDNAAFNGFNHFGFDFTVGGRYYFTDNIGIYGEIGLAKTPFQVGLVAKF